MAAIHSIQNFGHDFWGKLRALNPLPKLQHSSYVDSMRKSLGINHQIAAMKIVPPTLYLLPPIQRSRASDLRMLFLADGNNRAKGLNQGYDEGGKTIVRIAQALAQRGDVSTMVACIMSADNANKRSPEFFWKMYQAFSALGMRIEADGELLNANIRIEAYGQLEELRRAGGVQAQFIDMVESVCAQTAHLKKPSLRLLFGINYDRNIALDLGVDLIYRSGMEEECTLRLSGTRTRQGILCFSSPKLWPAIAAAEVEEVIVAAKRSLVLSFATGYEIPFIADLLRAAGGLISPLPMSLTIPFAGAVSALRAELDALYQDGTHGAPQIKLFSEDSKLPEVRNHYQGSNLEINLVSGLSIEPTQQRYDHILAVSENKQFFLLPDHFEVSYANIHYCDLSVNGILQGVRSALAFSIKHESLQGAERSVTADTPAEIKVCPELVHYQNLNRRLDPYKHLGAAEIIDLIHQGTLTASEGADSYNFVADVFVADVLSWARRMDIWLDSDVRFRAFVNYALTSFFVAYYPAHPTWRTVEPRWLTLADCLAKYMALVYQGDEAVFDQVYPGESRELLLSRLAASARYLQTTLQGNAPAQRPQLPSGGLDAIANLQALGKGWQEFLLTFATDSHPQAVLQWRTAMESLYGCSVKEHQQAVLLTRLAAGLADPAQWQNTVREIEQSYLREAPSALRQRLRELLATVLNQPSANKHAMKELQLFIYLLDINESIGAGLVYRTAALGFAASEITEERLLLLGEVAVLSNCYNRIANDMAGFFHREYNDREDKEDACSIMLGETAKTPQHSAAVIDGMARLKRIFLELEVMFQRSLDELQGVWPEMAILIKRAAIGIEIYRRGHYRTTSREQMARYFAEFMHFGAPAAIAETTTRRPATKSQPAIQPALR